MYKGNAVTDVTGVTTHHPSFDQQPGPFVDLNPTWAGLRPLEWFTVGSRP